jgi:hypothetical protein
MTEETNMVRYFLHVITSLVTLQSKRRCLQGRLKAMEFTMSIK